jgi:hypothetical protein
VRDRWAGKDSRPVRSRINKHNRSICLMASTPSAARPCRLLDEIASRVIPEPYSGTSIKADGSADSRDPKQHRSVTVARVHPNSMPKKTSGSSCAGTSCATGSSNLSITAASLGIHVAPGE